MINNSHSGPNVVLVITDDQGYGDLGCTGNPWIQTPNIDAFHGEATRLTDFHVSPLCTPTRGAIMSGRRPVRNGAWATTWGRSMLGKDEMTIADVFRGAGYRTAMFGKWHLGDNYPYRPQDRGFETVVAHKGGGVGQTPDFWGNNYFDDTYFRNGDPEDFAGYCTDIWFDEAKDFITAHQDERFFAYIATNAPHSPYLVADRYTAPYLKNPDIPEPAFYGMITNIDENFGELRRHLAALGLEDNTILIFMTDNGSSGGSELDTGQYPVKGYNAGMRGKKGSYYDGGHRVPFFVRWPNGGVEGPRDVDELGLHIDLLPTLAELCGVSVPDRARLEGESLAPAIRGDKTRLDGDRCHFLQYRQATDPPEKWTSAVISRDWRLVYGTELYEIKGDPGQRTDIAAEHPDIVEELRSAFETWWADIEPGLEAYHPVFLGNPAENPVRLDAFDVTGDVAWSQSQVAAAVRSSGRWRVLFERTGEYRFTLRRWPEELDLPLEAVLDDGQMSGLAPYGPGRSIPLIAPSQAGLTIFGTEHLLGVQPGVEAVSTVVLIDEVGECNLEAWFGDGERFGAYYVYVEFLG